MSYIKNISILIISLCLVFVPLSFISQICSGASVAHSQKLQKASSDLQKKRRSHKKVEGYTYYDAEYDDTQNELLAVQTLIERYAIQVNELGEKFLPAMSLFDAETLYAVVAEEWLGEKKLLEEKLKTASIDQEIQRQVLEDYYFFLERLLQDENIQQFLDLYSHYSLGFQQLKDKYFVKAKNNPFGYKLTENADTKKINPLYDEYRDVIAIAEKLHEDLGKIKTEFMTKTRKKQILEMNYVGIAGKWQKLSDFITGKGKFAK
ncbi:MAG: hypothetical protein AB8G05_27005 [Oligoflexales bacterium]